MIVPNLLLNDPNILLKCRFETIVLNHEEMGLSPLDDPLVHLISLRVQWVEGHLSNSSVKSSKVAIKMVMITSYFS